MSNEEMKQKEIPCQMTLLDGLTLLWQRCGNLTGLEFMLRCAM